MITDLHIKNFRLFEDFRMEGLAQVNLIAGKNNTGKTALLEALRILASDGENTVVNHILKNRGDFIPGWFESYESMINRKCKPSNGAKDYPAFEINDLILYCSLLPNNKIGRYYFKKKNEELSTLNSAVPTDHPKDEVVYVPFFHDSFPIQNLWKNISLTEKEEEVIRILKIIDPNINRIDILPEGAKVRLDGLSNPIPLKNLGDGANRILAIALSLVSAMDKLLLIDEFEAGLHHTVQEQLWEIIFEYAKKWNIQVFATTHSMDAVDTFFYVMDKTQYEGMGKFFRLQTSREGPIETITYRADDLQFAVETKLDPR